MCNDSNACTDDTCDPQTEGGCVYTADDNNPASTDSSECTIDTCVAGTATYTPRTCNDDNACTDDTCDPETAGGCVYTADDNNPAPTEIGRASCRASVEGTAT